MRKFGASGVIVMIIPDREANALVNLRSGDPSNSGTSPVKFMGGRWSPHRAFVCRESPPYLFKLLTDYANQDTELSSPLCILLFSPFPMWDVAMRSHPVMSSKTVGQGPFTSEKCKREVTSSSEQRGLGWPFLPSPGRRLKMQSHGFCEMVLGQL